MSASETEALAGQPPSRQARTRLRALIRSGMLRDQLVLISLTMVVNLLGLAFQFVMARLMDPGAWKDMFAVLALLALISVPSVALNTLAIKITGELHVRNQPERLWRWVLRTASLVGAGGVVVAIGLGLASGWISDVLQLHGSTSVVVAGMALVLMLASTVVKGALAGVRSFLGLGLVSVSETSVRLLAAAAMVTTGFAAAGAVGGSAAGAFVVVVAGLLVVRRAVHRKPASAHGDDSPLPRGGDQVRILAISFVLAAMLNTDIVFVNHFFDEGQAASYSAMALIGRTIFFMAGPVSIVLLPHVIRAFSSGESVVPSLFMAVGLILGLMSATAAVILLFPAQVFGLVFREGYTLDLTILTIYAAVGTLLALNAALANLHIGVGHLRPWRGLVAITVAMVAGMLVFHESPTQIAMVLAVAVGAGAAYLAGHTVGLVRRLEHGQVVGSSA